MIVSCLKRYKNFGTSHSVDWKKRIYFFETRIGLVHFELLDLNLAMALMPRKLQCYHLVCYEGVKNPFLNSKKNSLRNYFLKVDIGPSDMRFSRGNGRIAEREDSPAGAAECSQRTGQRVGGADRERVHLLEWIRTCRKSRGSR